MTAILQFLVFASPIFAQSIEEIDYYENLVTQQIEESANYKLPTDNSEYIPKYSEIEGTIIINNYLLSLQYYPIFQILGITTL